MAKSKGPQGYTGRGGAKTSDPLTSDPPVIIGGGSVNVYFKDNATEVLPSPKAGYRCFKLGGNVKKLAFYNGDDPGSSNLPVKNPKTFFIQAEEE
jgi:hypothetical protein